MRRSLLQLRVLPPNATAPAHPSYPSSSKYAIPSPDSFRLRGKTSFPPSLGGSPPLAGSFAPCPLLHKQPLIEVPMAELLPCGILFPVGTDLTDIEMG